MRPPFATAGEFVADDIRGTLMYIDIDVWIVRSKISYIQEM